jgi:RNA polymerase sigma factor (sigma-70 family)
MHPNMLASRSLDMNLIFSSPAAALISALGVWPMPLVRRRVRRSGHNLWVNRSSHLETQPPQASHEEAVLTACVLAMAAQVVQPEQAQAALSELYDAAVPRVYALVRRFCHEEGAAQEVVQDVFFQAWNQAERFDAERGSPMAWLLNIARSRALDAWRKTSNAPALIDSETTEAQAIPSCSTSQPADFLQAVQTRHHLDAALQQLPALTRQMLSLAFFQDLSHAEISQHMQMPLGTVKSSLRRGLLALRETLANEGLGREQLAALSLEETP